MTSGLHESDVRQRIRRHVEATFLPRLLSFKLSDDDRLLRKGIVDSMGAVALIKFLEAELGIEVCGDDITEENLGSVSAMTRFVIRKQTLGEGGGSS
jgi:methoxymalonate biosynthesis acyl carrier protein